MRGVHLSCYLVASGWCSQVSIQSVGSKLRGRLLRWVGGVWPNYLQTYPWCTIGYSSQQYMAMNHLLHKLFTTEEGQPHPAPVTVLIQSTCLSVIQRTWFSSSFLLLSDQQPRAYCWKYNQYNNNTGDNDNRFPCVLVSCINHKQALRLEMHFENTLAPFVPSLKS